LAGASQGLFLSGFSLLWGEFFVEKGWCMTKFLGNRAWVLGLVVAIGFAQAGATQACDRGGGRGGSSSAPSGSFSSGSGSSSSMSPQAMAYYMMQMQQQQMMAQAYQQQMLARQMAEQQKREERKQKKAAVVQSQRAEMAAQRDRLRQLAQSSN
jgi:hypothetical protein